MFWVFINSYFPSSLKLLPWLSNFDTIPLTWAFNSLISLFAAFQGIKGYLVWIIRSSTPLSKYELRLYKDDFIFQISVFIEKNSNFVYAKACFIFVASTSNSNLAVSIFPS